MEATKQAAEKEAVAREKEKKPQREEWMLLPPTNDDWSSRVDPTKLKNRRFQTGKGSKAPIDKSGGVSAIWTETPEQKRQRLEDEVLGRKATASSGPEKPTVSDKEDVAAAKRIKDYNVSYDSGNLWRTRVANVYARTRIATLHSTTNTKRLFLEKRRTILANEPLIKKRIWDWVGRLAMHRRGSC